LFGLDIFVVGLSGLNSNNCDTILGFKESIAVDFKSLPLPTDSLSSETRKSNEYGETVVSRITQEQRRLNDKEIKLLISEYEKGKSTYQLAKQFSCHRSTVSSILKKHGVVVSNDTAQKKLDPDVVIALYSNMYTTQQIAEKYEVNPNAVLLCLRKHGVKRRNRWDY